MENLATVVSCELCTDSGMLTNVCGDEAVCHCTSGERMLAYIQKSSPDFYAGYLAGRSTGPEDAAQFLAQSAEQCMR